MARRLLTPGRVIGVVLLTSSAWTTAASATVAASAPVLVHQDAAVTLRTGQLAVAQSRWRLDGPGTAGRVQISIFPRVGTVTDLTAIAAGGTNQAALATTTISLACTHGSTVTLRLRVVAGTRGGPPSPCGATTGRLRLACRAGGCDGVYPLRYRFELGARETDTWSFLTLGAGPVRRPVRVALLGDLDPASVVNTVALRQSLEGLTQWRGETFTVGVDYRALTTVIGDETLTGALRNALASPQHRVVNAPPSTVDYAGLATYAPTQLQSSVQLGASLVRQVTGRYVDAPLYLNGPVSVGAINALASLHDTSLVAPSSNTPAVATSSAGWSAPLHVSGAPSSTVLTTNDALDAVLFASGANPALASVVTENALNLLYFQNPRGDTLRSVVLAGSLAGWTPALLSQWRTDAASSRYWELSSLTPLDQPSLVGANGVALTYDTPTPSSTWSPQNVRAFRALSYDAHSFLSALNTPSEADVVQTLLAESAVVGSPSDRDAALASAQSTLRAQYQGISFDTGAITLTGNGAKIPVTIYSTRPYAMTAVVHLITDRLNFPNGANVPVSISAATTPLRVSADNPRGSGLILQVTLTTPNGALTLARAAIPVRYTGSSIVGYLLSAGSLLVLGLWWWRTTRRRRAPRHAR